VRVGRAALDQDAIRLIEEHHPHIHFDWPQILNGEEEVAPPEAPRREPEPRAAASATAPDAALVDAGPPETPVNPAHARLGSEGLARLRARYADVVATIGRRVQDEVRRQPLIEQAERLNPDTWVTDEEVSRGLEDYEAVLAALRDVVGRRRRRKRGRPGHQAAGPQPSTAGPPPDDEEGPTEPDEDPEGE